MGARLIGAIIGGAVAGAIGAAVWAAIAYFTGYEIGWIAWGIGALVGFGVAVGGRVGGPVPGLIAVVLSLVSILGGKWLSIQLVLDKELGDTSGLVSEMMGEMSNETVVSFIADSLIGEREAGGETVTWPAGVDPDEAYEESDYPADIWADAQSRWDAMSSSDRSEYRAGIGRMMESEFAQSDTSFRDEAVMEGFKASFGLMDIVFFGLAVFTAFRIGAAGEEDESEL